MTDPTVATRPPFWRNIRVLRVVAQVVVVLLVALGIRRLLDNLMSGLEGTGISTNFDFLSSRTGFRVADSAFDPSSPSWQLFQQGVKNTLLVAIVGIALASVVGLLVGIARLSSNWLLSKLATVFVETLRNIPPLVVIIFFFAAMFRDSLPAVRQARSLGAPTGGDTALYLSNSSFAIPSFYREQGFMAWVAVVGAAFAVAVALWMWRSRVEIETGRPARRVAVASGTLLVTSVVGLLVLDPLSMSWPRLEGNVIAGGFSFTTAYAALTLALALYTASHIAEIIRGSIQAVHRGQFEAAEALALSGFQRYRFVILPQALRIAVPPTINQFLNLTKNTSLAVAIGYPDVTNLTKSLIGNGKPAPQSILILMAIYLTFSLVISLVVNLLNRRLRLVGR
jgi:general L-amino acid transport system permease protein